jgi:hypothetical protein
MPHKDPEVKRAYLKAYKVAHRDRLREQRQEYNEAHRAENDARWKAWRDANPERRRAINARARRKFEQTHRDQILNKNSKRRARVLAVRVEHVDRLVVYRRDHGRCGLCGRFVARAAFEVDHIRPLAKGGEHSYANVQVSHPLCNRRKRDSVLEETA